MAKSIRTKKGKVTSNKGFHIAHKSGTTRESGSVIYEGSTRHIARNVLKKYSKAFENLSKK
jgi:hypothetical protein